MFNVLLKNYISKAGISPNEFANQLALKHLMSKATFYRILKGDVDPKFSQVRTLVQELRFTDFDKLRLFADVTSA